MKTKTALPRYAARDAAVQNANAWLISELAIWDPVIRGPLTSWTYSRDMPIKTGGGAIDSIDIPLVGVGLSGGSGAGPIAANAANSTPIVQVNFDKKRARTHIFEVESQINFWDMERSEMIANRNLVEQTAKAARLAYDKHLDQNAYLGFEEYGSEGLLNNSAFPVSTVSIGTSGGTTWASKTADEILKDINDAIIQVWAAVEYDREALPNHIILPYEQYNEIATRKVTDLADKTILTYLLENNVAKQNGGSLYIGATLYAKGAGTGGTDRMTVYCNDEKYIFMQEAIPFQMKLTEPAIERKAHVSYYRANVSEVALPYEETVAYFDGI